MLSPPLTAPYWWVPSILICGAALVSLPACRGEVHEGTFEVRGPAELEELAHYVRVEGSIVFAPGLGQESIELPKLERASSLVVERDATLRTLRLPALARVDKLELGDPDWPRAPLPRLESIELPRLVRVETLSVARAPLLERIELGALSEVEHHFSVEAESLGSLELPALTRAPYLSVAGTKLRAVDAPLLESGARVRIESEDPVTLKVRPELEVTVVERGRLARETARRARLAESSAASGELRQLGIGRDPAGRPLVVTGSMRGGHAIFVAREGTTGALRWSTSIPWPQHWPTEERGIPVLASAVGKVVLAHIWRSDEVGRVVALDPSDGHILWRREGTRAMLVGDVALVVEDEARPQTMTVELHTGEPIETLELRSGVDGRGATGFEPVWIGERLALLHGNHPSFATVLEVRDGMGSGTVARGRVVQRLRFFKGWPSFEDGEWVVRCSAFLPEPSGFEVDGKRHPCPHALERPATPNGPTREPSDFVTREELAQREYFAATDGRSPLGRLPPERAPIQVDPFDDPVFALGPYRVDIGGDPARENPSHLPYTRFGTFGTVRVQDLAGEVLFQLEASFGPGHPWQVYEEPLGARPFDRAGLRLGVLVDLGERGVAMAWIGGTRLEERAPEIVSAYLLRWGDEDLAESFVEAPRTFGRARAVRSLLGEGLHLVNAKGGALVDVHARRLVWSDNPDVELVDVTDEVRARWVEGSSKQAP